MSAEPVAEGTSVFVQWKGTDVCMDIYCVCGVHGHFDGYFAYALKCPKCGTVFGMDCNPKVLADPGEDVTAQVFRVDD